MKRSTKAILLSALVYPGAGQLYLKKYLVAAILISATTIALYFLLVPIIAISNEIAGKILSGELQLEESSLSSILAATHDANALHSINITSLSLVALWLIGVIHAWRAGGT